MIIFIIYVLEMQTHDALFIFFPGWIIKWSSHNTLSSQIND